MFDDNIHTTNTTVIGINSSQARYHLPNLFDTPRGLQQHAPDNQTYDQYEQTKQGGIKRVVHPAVENSRQTYNHAQADEKEGRDLEVHQEFKYAISVMPDILADPVRFGSAI